MSDLNIFSQAPRPRVIGRVNVIGLSTIVKKEIGRFLAVYTQTVIAPVVTTLLYYAVFALAFGGLKQTINGVSYMEFLAPGLIMMTMAQNAFANTSSSMVIAKVQGNIFDVLIPPLSAGELYIGYAVGGLVRGLIVGVACWAAIALFVPLHIHAPLQTLAFAVLGCLMLASLGLAGGIWSQKFDHLAAVTNFIITPLTFLSGTFYSIKSLPQAWQEVARYNPFFHMIDGLRYGFVGTADGPIMFGLVLLIACNVALAALCLWMLQTGYKIKS